MLRIRKKDGTATIKIIIEKECPVEATESMMETIIAEIATGFMSMSANIPNFDEVVINKDGDMATKKKREVEEPEEPEPPTKGKKDD